MLLRIQGAVWQGLSEAETYITWPTSALVRHMLSASPPAAYPSGIGWARAPSLTIIRVSLKRVFHPHNNTQTRPSPGLPVLAALCCSNRNYQPSLNKALSVWCGWRSRLTGYSVAAVMVVALNACKDASADRESKLTNENNCWFRDLNETKGGCFFVRLILVDTPQGYRLWICHCTSEES